MNIAYYRNLVILAGIGPLLMLGWDAWHDQLGANGVNNALHITGILSLVFLFVSLTVSPLKVITGWSSLIAYRRTLGLYGFAYAALHFVIYVLLDRMGSLRSTVEEIASRRFLTIGFVAVALMLPLALTSTNAMIRKLGPVRWKLLHRLAYAAAILGVVHYYMLVKSDVRQPLAFAAVLAPLLGFRAVKHYVDLRKNQTKGKHVATVSSSSARKFWNGELIVSNIQRETHDVKTFRFVVPGGGDIPFVHRAGQYMNLTLNINGKMVKRSYTIASAPSQRGHVELTIKRNPKGVASQYMHDVLKTGDSIRIGAPAGKFYFDDLNAKSVVLISGGVGITPLMSILRYLTDHAWGGDILFINAIRSSEDAIFAKEIETLAQRFGNLRVINYFSQSKPKAAVNLSTLRWQDNDGYIDAKDISAAVPELVAVPIFLCGPDPMMQAVRESLVSLGVPNEHIFTEEFVSPIAASNSETSDQMPEPSAVGLLEGQAATITFSKSGTMIDMDASSTILEAAEQAGVALPWECRSGICGQCKVRCTTGRVRMDSRNALSKGEEANGYILACQSHPIAGEVTIEA
jgi:ferredoxin-NADP reductase/DMSO/TMAO reductase YedYZ heme-binding membrane subunit